MVESKLLIETVKVLNWEVLNWEWHQRRMEESCRVLGISGKLPPNPLKGESGFSLSPEIRANNGSFTMPEIDLTKSILKNKLKFNLTSFIKANTVPPFRGIEGKNTLKCRITYSRFIKNIEFFPYTIKPIHSLKKIHANKIDYSLKYRNRTQLNKLHQQKGKADEVLIIKNGLVTDTTYANIVFEKKGQFFTPNSPLLKGTKRALLLEKKIIQEIKIIEKEIQNFEKIHLINAMMGLGECVIDCENVF